MQITTKFDVGQTVTSIKREMKTINAPACPVCHGLDFGLVTVDLPNFGKAKFNCPNKRPQGHGEYAEEVFSKWVIDRADVPIIKGMIRYEYGDKVLGQHPNWKPFAENRVTYALVPDTLNSHRVYDEDNLFATVAEAQAACDERNEV